MSDEEKPLFQEMVSGVPPNATNPREDILVKKPQHNTTQKISGKTTKKKASRKTKKQLVEIEELPPKDISKLPREKLKVARCPVGKRRNKKTGEC